MTVEAATTIAQLNTAWPLFDDQIIEGDDHIRLLKTVLKADALSRSLGTAQTIVGPVTFNGLVTTKGNIWTEGTTPVWMLRETDQALPTGLYRFSLSTDIFRFQKNTALAGDFTAATTLWSYTPVDSYLNLTANTRFTGVPRIETTQPRLELRETDTVLPGGLFRSMASAGNFHIQANTALAGDFSTAADILKFTGSTNRISFGYPVDFTGGFSPGQSLELAGAAPSLLLTETDQVDPAGRYRWAGVGGNLQLQKALTAAWATSEILLDYLPASGFVFSKPATFNAVVKLTSTTPQLQLLESDMVAPAGQYRHIVSVDTLFCQRALTADFATSKTIWSYDGATGGPFRIDGSIEVGGSGNIKMDGTSPVLWFHDSDGAVATRNFNIAANNGTMRFIKSDDVNATGTQMVVMDETSFSVPILCKLGSGGNLVEIGNTASAFIDFKRTGSPNIIRVPDGASLRVQNMTGTSWATVSSASGWAAGTSDIRLKENVQPIRYGLDTIMALRPIQFDWIAEKRHDIGFSAQEVEEIIPEIVEVWEADPDVEGQIDTYAMRKDALTVILVRAVQELTARLEAIEGASA
jgi:hypothetical protein